MCVVLILFFITLLLFLPGLQSQLLGVLGRQQHCWLKWQPVKLCIMNNGLPGVDRYANMRGYIVPIVAVLLSCSHCNRFVVSC